MTKILIILVIGLICEAAGVVLLKEGIDSVTKGRDVTLVNVMPIVLKGITNLRILAGVALEAVFFACLLYLMSQKDISFVWPLTSLSFVMTTVAAVLYLKEPVTAARWAGVALIMLGAGLITWSEKAKEAQRPALPAASHTVSGEQ
jgi:drug/metabolite transporter (DMT)-like permease